MKICRFKILTCFFIYCFCGGVNGKLGSTAVLMFHVKQLKLKMKTGDPIEDYPEYMHDAVNDICNGDFATKVIGFYRLIIGIVVFPIIKIIKLLT